MLRPASFLRRYRCDIASVVMAMILPIATNDAHGQEEYIYSETDDAWTATATPDPGSPEGQLATLRRLLASEEYERARILATQWIERYPRHPRLPDAYLARADAKRGRGNYYEALFDYEYTARVFTGSEAFVTALERELEIAKLFAGGLKRKLWGMRIVDTSDEAEELFIRIQERMPASQLAEDAGIALADFYFDRRDMPLATEAYTIFIGNYPQSRYLSQARRRLIYSHLASFKGPEFDGTGLYEARSKLLELQAAEPATAQQIGAEALLSRINDSDAQKMLTTARWYIQTGDIVAAEFTIRRLLRRYPRTNAAREALPLTVELWSQLPETVRAEAPDYEAYRAGLLEPAAGDGDENQP